MAKRKREDWPENAWTIGAGGTGLWEVWYDNGSGTPARPVFQSDLSMAGPRVWLFDNEAAESARVFAAANPDRRYCVKLRSG